MVHWSDTVRLAFRNVFRFSKREPVNWYLGHSYKGNQHLQQKIRQTDCIIEVHDARLPITGRNYDFVNVITDGGKKPHILVLNKKDLTDRCDHLYIKRQLLRRSNLDKHIIFTNSRKPDCPGIERTLNLALKLILESARHNYFSRHEHDIIVTGIPNVGKRSFINNLFSKYLASCKAHEIRNCIGNKKFKVQNKPKIYVIGMPEITMPCVKDDEMGLKLSLIGAIPDKVAGEEKIADYLLYWLNQHKRFEYVKQMGLRDPEDNILKVLMSCGLHMQRCQRMKQTSAQKEDRNELEAAAAYFLELFRTGELGAINLDECT